jgi:hypothetical protein
MSRDPNTTARAVPRWTSEAWLAFIDHFYDGKPEFRCSQRMEHEQCQNS